MLFCHCDNQQKTFCRPQKKIMEDAERYGAMQIAEMIHLLNEEFPLVFNASLGRFDSQGISKVTTAVFHSRESENSH